MFITEPASAVAKLSLFTAFRILTPAKKLSIFIHKVRVIAPTLNMSPSAAQTSPHPADRRFLAVNLSSKHF